MVKISACVIVKDEEQNLPRWLKCMQQIADEIIVIDTGSVDNTKNIAICAGAQVYDFKWQDDFAAAKNYAINKASGEWILFLDADEYFSQETSKYVRKNIIDIDPAIKIFMCRLTNINEQGKPTGTSYMVRGLRNKPGLRYKGPIHEQLFYYNKEITNIAVMSDVEICHTGYSPQIVEKKLRRNLRIIRNDIQKNGDNKRYYASLADCYYGLGEYEKAILFARKFIESGLTALGGELQVYYTLAAAMQLSGKSYAEINTALAQYGMQLLNGHIKKKALIDMKKFFISACVIVKNEEKNINQYLKYIHSVADEIILVDTGSQDNTCSIAQKAGAKIYKFKWCDDFAAAKNYALDKAHGKWIIFLDADEYFPDETGMQLISYIKKYDSDNTVDALVCKLINIDADKDNKFISSFYQLRAFRNLPCLRYTDHIHESLHRNDKKQIGMIVLPDDIHILHTGYSSSIMKKKALRNLTLIQKEIEKNGERPEYYSYLADCYYSLDDFPKTAYYSKKFIDSGITMIGAETNIYTRLIDALSLSGHRDDEILAAVDLAITKFPSSAEFLFMKSFFLLRQHHYIEAEKYLKKTFTVWHTGKKMATMSIIPHLINTIYGTAGTLAQLKGNTTSAIRYFEKSLQQEPCNEKYFVQLYNLLKYRPIHLIIKIFNSIYRNNEKYISWLVTMLQKHDKGPLLLHYSPKIKDEELQLWAGKNYSALNAILADKLDKIYKSLIIEALANNQNNNYKQLDTLLPITYKKVFTLTKEKLGLD